MRDDDFEPGDEAAAPPGRVYYPAFNVRDQAGYDQAGYDQAGDGPESCEIDVEPADYALPPGTPALQGWGPERATAASVDRRNLLLSLGAALGYWIGWRSAGANHSAPPSGSQAASDSVMLRNALWAADASIEDLVAYHHNFVHVVESVPESLGHHTTLWRGMRRLADYALDVGGEKGVRIARHLLVGFGMRRPPLAMAGQAGELARMIENWEREQSPNRRR